MGCVMLWILAYEAHNKITGLSRRAVFSRLTKQDSEVSASESCFVWKKNQSRQKQPFMQKFRFTLPLPSPHWADLPNPPCPPLQHRRITARKYSGYPVRRVVAIAANDSRRNSSGRFLPKTSIAGNPAVTASARTISRRIIKTIHKWTKTLPARCTQVR